MKPNPALFAAVAAAFLAAATYADASPAAQQKIGSVQYLVGTWNCAHTVGTFSGTYTTPTPGRSATSGSGKPTTFPLSRSRRASRLYTLNSSWGMTRGGRPGCALASSVRASTSPSG